MKRRVPSALFGDYQAQLLLFTNVLPSGCWEFGGYITPHGYGQLGRNIGAHRLAWEVSKGRPVPDGLVIDHQCHNLDATCTDDAACRHRRCINPDHLEAVPNRVNLIRGHGFAGVNAAVTHCPGGHEYTEANTYFRPDRPGRLCRQCRQERAAQARGRGRDLVRPDSPVIRAWAIAEGIPISDRGSIPDRVRGLYESRMQGRRAA